MFLYIIFTNVNLKILISEVIKVKNSGLCKITLKIFRKYEDQYSKMEKG